MMGGNKIPESYLPPPKHEELPYDLRGASEMNDDIEILKAILEEWEDREIDPETYFFQNALAMFRLKVRGIEWPPE